MLKKLRVSRFTALIGVLFLALILITPALAPADEQEEEQATGISSLEELRAMEAQLKENYEEGKRLQQIIDSSAAMIDQYRSEIAVLDAQLTVLALDIDAMETAIAALDLRIEAALVAIEEATERLEERQAYLESRVYNIYVTGNKTLLDVYFAAASFEEFLMLYDAMERILESDKEVLDEIFAERTIIEEEKANLQLARAGQQQVLDELEIQAAELERLSTEKEIKVAEENQTLAEAEAARQSLEEASAAAEAEIKQWYANNPDSSRSFGGVFQWPLPADQTYITSEYGMRTHPIYGTQTLHAGLDIGAPNGTNIYAAAVGEVIFSGWNGGYGNCIMVAHGTDGNGNTVVTLYAHMSGYNGWSVGDTVGTSDVIGYVGSTGTSTGNHLHFEVRINGSSTNPRPYLGI